MLLNLQPVGQIQSPELCQACRTPHGSENVVVGWPIPCCQISGPVGGPVSQTALHARLDMQGTMSAQLWQTEAGGAQSQNVSLVGAVAGCQAFILPCKARSGCAGSGEAAQGTILALQGQIQPEDQLCASHLVHGAQILSTTDIDVAFS